METAPDPRPTDWPLRAAAAVSTLLALPGLAGAGGLAYFLVVMLEIATSASGSDFAVVGGIVATFLLPLVGFYLLPGYWRAAWHEAPARDPRRFWWLSAAYNALGIVLTLTAAAMGGFDRMGLMVTPLGLAWLAFMVWLGVTRARGSRPAGPLPFVPSP
ncbi:MAG TPA: hypothetical protein VGB53_15965 [Rubricoccaceae bacterium]|jgi:hypothetical protein